MKDELIRLSDALEAIYPYCADDDGSCTYADRDLRELLDDIEALPTIDIPTWIPCSERLPEEGDCIIVQSADGRLELMPSVRMRIWEIMEKYSEFVAWMPLPMPYKEKSDE